MKWLLVIALHLLRRRRREIGETLPPSFDHPAPVIRYSCCKAPVAGKQHTTRCPWWNDSDPYGEDYGANSIFGMG